MNAAHGASWLGRTGRGKEVKGGGGELIAIPEEQQQHLRTNCALFLSVIPVPPKKTAFLVLISRSVDVTAALRRRFNATSAAKKRAAVARLRLSTGGAEKEPPSRFK